MRGLLFVGLVACGARSSLGMGHTSPEAGEPEDAGRAIDASTSEDASIDVALVDASTDAGAVTVVQLGGGAGYNCALLSNGTVKCWGGNAHGCLGDGTLVSRTVPTLVGGLSDATAIFAGAQHTCATHANGDLVCWGNNGSGQLGDGTQNDSTGPVTAKTSNTITARTMGNHTCALASDGEVRCWGDNTYGEVGSNALLQPVLSPVLVSELQSSTAQLATGRAHSCALDKSGGVRCWGWNTVGQLGDGMTDPDPVPVPVAVSGLAGAIEISSSHFATCAVLSNGSVRCWGTLASLSSGTPFLASATPVTVLSNGVVHVGTGYYFGCGLMQAGNVKCWGDNFYGELGNGTTTESTTPVDVSGITTAVALVVGATTACALLADGNVRCWGENTGGAVGDGTTVHRSTPTLVVGLP